MYENDDVTWLRSSCLERACVEGLGHDDGTVRLPQCVSSHLAFSEMCIMARLGWLYQESI